MLEPNEMCHEYVCAANCAPSVASSRNAHSTLAVQLDNGGGNWTGSPLVQVKNNRARGHAVPCIIIISVVSFARRASVIAR